ncbi:MAG: hypothetical protein Q9213_007129 [Squamulea squamosa]
MKKLGYSRFMPSGRSDASPPNGAFKDTGDYAFPGRKRNDIMEKEMVKKEVVKKSAGLDDLCVRFIINLPQEELESVERICFQVEEAQWYYEDFIRPSDPELPSLNLRNFCLRIFQHCPLLSEFSPYHHATAFEEFLAYKTRVPVRGAIMLNQDMDQLILVKGWKKGANWSFPRGKINKDESDLDCALREVYEETGYDVEAAGLVGSADRAKYIDVAIQHQHIRLYVFRGVSMNTQFQARTRKEISKIDWWRLSDLPTLKKKKQQQEGRGEDLAINANRFYMVAPFLVPLKKWISQQKRLGKSNSADQIQIPINNVTGELRTETNGLVGDKAVPTSEDMGRLLAGLRQPLSKSDINAIPTPTTGNSTDAASLQLKSLLHVPSEHNTKVKTQISAQSSKASTLLALLKGDTSKQEYLKPQTPLDHLTGVSEVSTSPKPQHAMEPRLAALPPPPVFQLDQNHNIQRPTEQSAVPVTRSFDAPAAQVQQASINAWNTFESTSAIQDAERKRLLAEKKAVNLAREEQTGVQHAPRLPVMNETWRQVKVHDASNMHQANQRQVVNVVKRPVGSLPQQKIILEDRPIQQRAALSATPQPTAAPYQATSKTAASDKLQYQDIYRPTIPAANKLPMPKFTSHSSSLLDLFKNGQLPKVALVPMPASSSPSAAPWPQTLGNAGTNSQVEEQQQPQVPGTTETSRPAGSPPGAPPPAFLNMSDAKKPQSTHQASLLDLFRKPSVSAKASKPPSQMALDVPANLVELSAMPSPSHSRHTSKANVDGRQKNPSFPNSEPNYLRKHSTKGANYENPPVSATVNGPLNVPQFEMIARKVEASGNRRPTPVQEVRKSPVKILSRPSTAKATQQTGVPEAAIANGEDAKTCHPLTGPKPKTEQPHESKPFQPQILRRPPPTPGTLEIPQPSSAPPSAHMSNVERNSPSPLSVSDQHPLIKSEHKATLLSLFTKTSSPSHLPQSISQPDFSAFVSPVATKPPSSFPLFSERVNSNLDTSISRTAYDRLPHSRKGSETLPPSVGISRIHSAERRTLSRKPTSDADRNFLLGYLDSVAKKEGR